MKTLLLILCFLSSNVFAQTKTLTLSRDIYKPVPFSTLYSDAGALIKNVNYDSLKSLRAQLSRLYKVKLEDRGEAHITMLTPPEYADSIGKVLKISDILKFYEPFLQDIPFKAICVGSQRSRDGKNLVFYLVVRKSPALMAVRRTIGAEALKEAQRLSIPFHFDADVFWPHVTIGYVGGDVFDFPKGPKSCLPDTKLEFI